MKRLATLLLLCLATTAQAAVYRWIDTYGEVQYGDKPPAGVAVEAAEGKVKRYRRLLITQPTDGQTIRSDDGLINVAVDLRPALQEVAGHRLIAVVDGRRIPGGGSRIPVRVPRGSHRLQVAVIDVDGRVVARSRKISFDMRPKTRLPIPAELGGIEGLAPAPAPLPSN
jgi:hypothetical protein